MTMPDTAALTRLLPRAVHRVCRVIESAGGHAWLVGGSVRDLLLERAPKDFDIECYGLDAAALRHALQPLGRCQEVGRKFGVLKLWTDGLEMDIALPRREAKQGRGHRGFAIVSDPHLPPETACARRDFTMNAMLLDPLSGELLDFFHGREHLEQGILRHISPAFAEDPLRPLRAMQFAARFRLKLDAETAALCRELTAEAATLPAARIWEEWRKWAHAPAPSYGLRALQQSGWLDCHPELAALVGCPQDKQWHPEGDVWTHTCLVADAAARAAKRRHWHGETREQLLFAALCHDLGKPPTTLTDENGRIRSTGHSEEGVAPARAFLARIGAPEKLVKHILPLVREHLVHLHGQATARAVRRLANRLQPSNIGMWEALVEADASGRPPRPADRPALDWLEIAKSMEIQAAAPAPLLNGNKLKARGIAPGPAMGELLDAAYQAQLDGEFTDAESADQWLSRKLANK